MSLKVLKKRNGNLHDGEPIFKAEYEGYGYLIKAGCLMGVKTIDFTPLRNTLQPKIVYSNGSATMYFDGNMTLSDIDEVIQNLKDAKNMLEYISKNEESLFN